MIQSVQTTEHVINTSVSTPVTMVCLVERMLSALRQDTELYANVQLDGVEILPLNASSVRDS